MAKTAEEKQLFKDWMNAAFLPVWRGHVDDWQSGINYLVDKTGWTAESIKTDVLPWLYEWNRQKDAADKAKKFMADLPNIGVFFRKQKWKNPLPYSFSELKIDGKDGEKQVEQCACGEPAFNRKECSRCYTKKVDPTYQEHMRQNLRNMGLNKKSGESWRDACLRVLQDNGLMSLVPKSLK